MTKTRTKTRTEAKTTNGSYERCFRGFLLRLINGNRNQKRNKWIKLWQKIWNKWTKMRLKIWNKWIFL